MSAANSLVGTTANDQVGFGATALTNGNYVVRSPFWNNGAIAAVGAVTFGNGTSGISGAVSAANSLVGTTTNDQVGISGITTLTNGNYVVSSPNWDNGAVINAGAATFGSGTTGIAGAVSAANSLVGTTTSDQVGISGITALSNGNYVVRSGTWDNGAVPNAGAVTWGSGTIGVSGAVSTVNSLVGNTAGDNAGSGGITALSNGNFIVNSPLFDNGAVDSGKAVIYVPGSGFFNPVLFGDNPASGLAITPAQITAITNAGTAVTLQANNDITLAAGSPIITTATGPGGNITLQAGRSVTLNSNITTASGNLSITANDPGAIAANRDAGNAAITMASGTSINAGSGNISMTLSSAGVGPTGDITLGSLTTTGAVNVLNQGAGAILRNATASPITASSITLASGSIGTNTAGGNIGVSPGASGTVNLASTAGGIHVEQSGTPLLTSQYTFSAPAGQLVTLASSGGDLVVDSDINIGSSIVTLLTTGANNITFSGNRTFTGTNELGFDAVGTGSVIHSAGTTTFNVPTLITAPLSLAGGTVTGTGNVTAEGGFNWTGGTISGTGGSTFTTSGASALSGGATKVLDGRTWNNAGAMTISGGDLQMQNGAVFNNQAAGSIDIQSDVSFTNGGSAGAFNNAGSIVKSAGSPGAFTRWFMPFNNSGTLTQNSPTTFTLLQGGTHSGSFVINNNSALEFCCSPTPSHTLTATSSVTGNAGSTVYLTNADVAVGGSYNPPATEVRPGSTLTMNAAGGALGALNLIGGTLAMNAATSATSVNFSSGSLTGAGNFTVTGGYSQTGGTDAGTGGTILGPASTSSLGAITLARSLTNQGTLGLSGTTLNGLLTNAGTVNVSGSSTANAGVVQQAGALNVVAGQSLTAGGSGLDWQGGTLGGTGDYSLAGLSISGSGARVINGPTISLSNLTVPGGSLTVQGGALNLAGTTSIAAGTLLAASGGPISATGPVNVDGTLQAAVSGPINATGQFLP